jgi:hypothetical protein
MDVHNDECVDIWPSYYRAENGYVNPYGEHTAFEIYLYGVLVSNKTGFWIL